MKEKDAVRESDIADLYERQTKESPLTDSDPPTLLEAYSCTSQYSLGPVMLDPTMRYNYLGDVSPNYMKLLQLHARKGLEALKASRSAFRSLFMDSARFWTQWDLYVKIRVPEATEDDWELTTRSLVRKLEMALGNRINGIRLLSTGNGDVQLKKESADEIPTEVVSHTLTYIRRRSQSPTGSNEVVLGIAVNPETSCRVVDRGPPSDQAKAVKKFVQLWGERKAQLRRFKDGAIVQAVVWNDDDSTLTYQNCERVQGGYIGKIVRHIVGLHYTKEPVEFSLPHILSVVDGIRTNDEMSNSSTTDPFAAHQHVMKAYESLVDSLRRHSQSSSPENSSGASSLGLPLPIDAVEPLSPCLRYSELFPPTSHPFLGGSASHSKRISGVLLSDPILIQIRFGATSKWPADLKAIASAKAAMLVQIANGIDSMNDRKFVVPALVTPNYLDIGYCGYCFRILIRADPEIKILEGLVQPSPEAVTLLKDLTRAHIISAKHHSMIHAVHTLHPSAAFVVRIAKRWCASHLLSGLVSTQVIELVVARVYSDGNSPIGVPSTLLAGFMGFLRLLGGHDWAGYVLKIVSCCQTFRFFFIFTECSSFFIILCQTSEIPSLSILVDILATMIST
jgi:U3 small nucleolar RNA-associated protein 22